MDRDELIAQLRSLQSEIVKMGVLRLVLFGPAARNEDTLPSEVNFLVELAPPITFEHYLAVRNLLADVLGRSVELVMEDLHHPNIWPYIQDEAIEI